MASAKKIKTKDGYYLKVPEEIWKEIHDSAEIFRLREGYFMLTPSLAKTEGKEEKPAEKKEENDKFALLYDISLIPFNRRDVESIGLSVSPRQKSMLEEMISNKTVSIFEKGGKRFIQFSPELYSKLKEYTKAMKGETANPETREAQQASQSRPAQAQRTGQGKVGDFAVFSKDEFREFQRNLDPKESKYLIILPWFDGKVYVGSRTWLMSWGEKAIEVLRKKKELTNDELASELKVNWNGARTIAISLCNEGMIIESKKGYYSLVE
ncbi:MAG: hypothetical protein NTY68_01590 [Candidatus Micrarchaeota archaeon]|nr:hypothetical protein [Candidatus Micrarchaeota archaeon]